MSDQYRWPRPETSPYVTEEAESAAMHATRHQPVTTIRAIRAALVAAAPHIRRAVLREAVDWLLSRVSDYDAATGTPQAICDLAARMADEVHPADSLTGRPGHVKETAETSNDAVRIDGPRQPGENGGEGVSGWTGRHLVRSPSSPVTTDGPEQAGKNEGDRAGLVGRVPQQSPSSPVDDFYEDDEPVENLLAIIEEAKAKGRVLTTSPSQAWIDRALAAFAAVERVRALHTRVLYDEPDQYCCDHCYAGGENLTWPCPTIRALDGEADG